MKNLKILYKLKNFIIIFLILFLCNPHNVIAEKQEDIIAVVNGKLILYKEVSIDKNMVSVMAKNEEEKNKIILELEKKQLSLLIIKTVEQSLIKRFNIYIAPNEEKLYIKEYLKQKNIMPQINTLMEERVYPVIKALEEYLKTPNEGDKIYQKYLSAIINKEQWNAYLKLYNSKEKIEKLKEVSKISEENIENKISPLLQEDSLRKKLSEVIIQNTIITDEELKDFYNRKYKDKKEKPLYNEIIDKLKVEYINENRKNILTKEWQGYISKCNIEIKHKDFSGVLEYIKENHFLK